MRLLAVSAGTLVLCGCETLREAVSSDVSVVARAEGDELRVDRLAQIMAVGKALPLTLEVVEGMARLWVDYSLLARRTAAGDSLLDSATVVASMWGRAQQKIADRFHEKLSAQRSVLDSSGIDSAYAAGEYRILTHILIRTETDMSPGVKAVKQRQAEVLRAQLMDGMSWEEANQQNEAPTAGDLGNVGMGAHGDFVESFENAAFALAPREISEVTQTTRGFHVIRRPPLEEVREQFQRELQVRLRERSDSAYIGELVQRWDIQVNSAVAGAVRQAARDPIRGMDSHKVIGTYVGGRFTVSDFVRWLWGFSPEIQKRLTAAPDDQVVQFVESLMRNQVLVMEAEEDGVGLTDEDVAEFKDRLMRRLALLRAAMRIAPDSLDAAANTELERYSIASLRVDEYLEATAKEERRFIPIPSYLANLLREEHSWRVIPAGLERVLDRARELRSAMTSDASSVNRSPGADQ